MNIEFVIQDSTSGIIYDLSEVSGAISWTTQMDGQPGKLEFAFINQENISPTKGSIVTLKVEGKGLFYGYLFSSTVNNNEETQLVCYDQLRYLKNKDTYVFKAGTSSQRFAQICKDKNLKHAVKSVSGYSCPAKIHDNISYYDMIQDALDQTLIKAGAWFMVRDNFGTLEHVDINSLKTNLFIGDESGLSSYSFTRSIDSDSFNKVKLIKENKETGKREVFIVLDSTNIKKWGELQYFEKVDEKANNAQIAERANMLLKAKNRETKTLSIQCLGDTRIAAGSGIVLGISALEKNGLPINQYYMVLSCKHTFDNNLHLMTLEMQVSI